jgi:hypothetical protein
MADAAPNSVYDLELGVIYIVTKRFVDTTDRRSKSANCSLARVTHSFPITADTLSCFEGERSICRKTERLLVADFAPQKEVTPHSTTPPAVLGKDCALRNVAGASKDTAPGRY